MMGQSIDEDQDIFLIRAVINQYFEGLYHGHVLTLRAVFHPDTWLIAPGARRSMSQWLTDVADRPAPVSLGQAYRFEILSIDRVQDQAMVKIKCPLFDFNYVDFLGLLKERGQWLIVSKMYTDVV